MMRFTGRNVSHDVLRTRRVDAFLPGRHRMMPGRRGAPLRADWRGR